MLLQLQDYIEKTNHIATVEELIDSFIKEVHKLGYDRMAFCLLSDHSDIGLSAGVGYLNNYPETWTKYYLENSLDKVDPVLSYGRQKIGAFSWDEMAQSLQLSGKQKMCLDFGVEAKLFNGLFTPLWGPHRFSGISLATTEKNDACIYTRNTLDLITAYSNHFYLSFQRLHKDVKLNNDGLDNVFLTSKEYEVLIWVARGKSNNDVGDILYISSATVNYHLKNIFRKLQVHDRVVACTKAIALGLISP